MQNQPNAPQNDHERGNTKPGDSVKPEALQEADSRRKNQCSCKGERQSTAVDLALMLIVRPKKAQQEQDRRHCCHDSQSQ